MMNSNLSTDHNLIKEKAGEWPGKSSGHPVVWHMLDVAACAELLLNGHHLFKKITQAEKNAFLILIALHDVGKLTNEFKRRLANQPVDYFHSQLSDVLLVHYLNTILETAFSNDCFVLELLYASVSGHHGGPHRTNDRLELYRQKAKIGESGEKFSKNWTQCLIELFPGASLQGLDIKTAKTISWVLSGLVVAADWIGSNEDWFLPQLEPISPERYLILARKKAKHAVRKAGLERPEVNKTRNGNQLLGLNHLRPMQLAVENAEIPDEPFLAIIEDSTGSGKTEAAIILAHRILKKDYANGLYFALPTMATANAMFNRMQKIIARIFTSIPTLSLVHGRSQLHDGYKDIIGIASDSTVESNCTTWLADDRRRSLLADVGVGTIDQALLGILPTKFATLRLFGLANRILIIDEAHAYDPYMQRQLEILLKMHGMNCGSAILMTATLPKSMRQSYINAYCKGRGINCSSTENLDYPGITFVSSSRWCQPVDPVKSSCRSLKIKCVSSLAKAEKVIHDGVGASASCVWIRNSVDEAISTAKKFITQGYDTRLLHARFAMGDRIKNEEEIVTKFGRDRKNRSEEVVIATQVVEASLDLDFDVMVSDLAPIGALIQRAGRLWRHMDMRPEEQRPVTGPTLNVLSPDPDVVHDDQWLHQLFEGGAWVYAIGDSWRTAKILFDTGEIKTPEGLRELIAFVHGELAPEVPKPLGEKDLVNQGIHLAEFAQAQNNVIEVFDGYLLGTMGRVWSDEKFPTRLGETSTTLVLAKRGESGLIPWFNDDSLTRAWALSEVSCSVRRLSNISLPNQSNKEIKEVKKLWSAGKKKYNVLCPVEDNGFICEGLKYSSDLGLEFVQY